SAVSINWGMWGEVGLAASLARQPAMAVIPMSTEECIIAFQKVVMLNINQIVVCRFNTSVARPHDQSKSVVSMQCSNQVIGAKNVKENASYMKQHSSESIVTQLEMVVRSIMGISTSRTVDHGQGFVDMGMDSLMMVELRSRLMKEFSMQSDQIQSTIAFDYPTVEKLTKFLEHILVVHGDEPSRSVNSVVH
ncbi:MAG: hypothetical protein GY738_23465, partial [Pseudoalteromonas sp.]|nr:hypothetical protein [Pseudoalteromonas sp.]